MPLLVFRLQRETLLQVLQMEFRLPQQLLPYHLDTRSLQVNILWDVESSCTDVYFPWKAQELKKILDRQIDEPWCCHELHSTTHIDSCCCHCHWCIFCWSQIIFLAVFAVLLCTTRNTHYASAWHGSDFMWLLGSIYVLLRILLLGSYLCFSVHIYSCVGLQRVKQILQWR